MTKPKPKKPQYRVHALCTGIKRRVEWDNYPFTVRGFGTARTPEVGDQIWVKMRSKRTAVFEVTKVDKPIDRENYIAHVKPIGFREDLEDEIHVV